MKRHGGILDGIRGHEIGIELKFHELLAELEEIFFFNPFGPGNAFSYRQLDMERYWYCRLKMVKKDLLTFFLFRGAGRLGIFSIPESFASHKTFSHQFCLHEA